MSEQKPDSFEERSRQCVRKLGWGLWVDGNGHGHCDVPVMLELAGLEDTPENRLHAIKMVQEVLAETKPQVQTITRLVPPEDMQEPIQGYTLGQDGKTITCLRCMRTSYNPSDVQFRYCDHCKVFHADVVSPANWDKPVQ